MTLSEILIKAAQLILSLSILVVLHEMGHFVAAKVFKCRVEKFYLFFDPWFSLFKKKVGETEYGIGWLPLGGYVKISGMIDESMDKEQMQQPAEPWEFRSKPAWQRLIIMIGGVTVNLLLAFFLFAMVLFVWGEKQLPMESLRGGVLVNDSLGYELGFRDGDKILDINGQPVKYFEDLMPQMVYAKQVKIERDGSVLQLDIPHDFIGQLVDNRGRSKTPFLFSYNFPVLVGKIPDSSLARGSGLRKGDHIVAVAGTPTPYYDDVRSVSKAHKGEKVPVKVMRDGSEVTLQMQLSPEGAFGFVNANNPDDLERLGFLKFETTRYGFLQSFAAGTNMAIDRLTDYVRQFKLIFQPSTGAYKGLGGFGTIASIFPSEWDWQAFWTMTAFLSVILAFMNILPIPALDGGHVMFLLYEMVTGRKPSDKFLEYAQIAGMVILFGLLLFANGMDVWRGIRGWFGG
ncbi:RIP metalloprotease RseP [Compostibacter hankyongensis]|uniref:Zinc metalloprotease n=1 Tax=Compostibacter hankyongensis TaxID=1007089 RepID=A0ABP8G9X1_9BACT